MLPKSLLCFLLAGVVVVGGCDVADAGDNPLAAPMFFERGYAYIGPDTQHAYLLNAADLQAPIPLPDTAGATALHLSRDAQHLAYVARPSGAQADQLYVLSTRSGRQQALLPPNFVQSGGFVYGPSFSADGRQVAFSYSDGNGLSIGLANADGTAARRVNFNAGSYFSPNFKDANTLWVVSLEAGNMALVEMEISMGLELDRRMQVSAPPPAPASRLTLSPNGNAVAWSATVGGQPRIFVWALTGAVWQLTEHAEGEEEAHTLPFWKDATTVLWTTHKAGTGTYGAYAARFDAQKTAGTLELDNALHALYGPY